MPRLYVPAIGDRLELTKDWEFRLHHEYRNETMFAALGLKYDDRYWSNRPKAVTVTLPQGTVLRVDRIYIRQGLDEFSSMSFFAEGLRGQISRGTLNYVPVPASDKGKKDVVYYGKCPGIPSGYAKRVLKTKTTKRAVRFWAKLDDCNCIEFKPATIPVSATKRTLTVTAG